MCDRSCGPAGGSDRLAYTDSVIPSPSSAIPLISYSPTLLFSYSFCFSMAWIFISRLYFSDTFSVWYTPFNSPFLLSWTSLPHAPFYIPTPTTTNITSLPPSPLAEFADAPQGLSNDAIRVVCDPTELAIGESRRSDSRTGEHPSLVRTPTPTPYARLNSSPTRLVPFTVPDPLPPTHPTFYSTPLYSTTRQTTQQPTPYN